MNKFKVGDVVRRIIPFNGVDLNNKKVYIPIGDVGVIIYVFLNASDVKYFNGITCTNDDLNLELVENKSNV